MAAACAGEGVAGDLTAASLVTVELEQRAPQAVGAGFAAAEEPAHLVAVDHETHFVAIRIGACHAQVGNAAMGVRSSILNAVTLLSCTVASPVTAGNFGLPVRPLPRR